MTKLFGTDGIRGTPGIYPLNDTMLAQIARAAAQFILTHKEGGKKKPRLVIGKDTRLSGEQIEDALADRLSAFGVEVLLAGIITTPGLAFLVKEWQANMGIMISASHNIATDNGLKFFNSKGFKLSTQEEEKIENLIFAKNLPQKKGLKKRGENIRLLKDTSSKYVRFLLSTVKGLNLKGMRLALDCAWGSASGFAPAIFQRLEAEVHSIHDEPYGENINIGGTLEPALLKELALKKRCHIGIALDGDGDRAILIDEKGNILDGDFILAIMANHWMKKKRLPKNSIVTTVMCNFGLRAALDKLGGTIIQTPVGDKFVLEELIKHNLNLGGEQSGHIIFLDYLPAPDGLLTALQLLQVMKEANTKLSELAKIITKSPQVLVNIKVKEKKPFEQMPALNERLKRYNAKLKDEGRILLRYSGTEPLARVMVEGRDEALIKTIAHSLANQIRQEIGTD